MLFYQFISTLGFANISPTQNTKRGKTLIWGKFLDSKNSDFKHPATPISWGFITPLILRRKKKKRGASCPFLQHYVYNVFLSANLSSCNLKKNTKFPIFCKFLNFWELIFEILKCYVALTKLNFKLFSSKHLNPDVICNMFSFQQFGLWVRHFRTRHPGATFAATMSKKLRTFFL